MIWKAPLDLETLNRRSNNTMASFCQIQFIAYDNNSLTARMPVNDRTKQPLGILHGGASCVLAETVGSTAANFCVDSEIHYCVGLSIDVNHIRKVSEGSITAIAKPLHCGSTTQVWQIDLYDDTQKMNAAARLTMAVLSCR
jgi:1,4-dihydroxy-2-naphthoyl-CoA hydrolase